MLRIWSDSTKEGIAEKKKKNQILDGDRGEKKSRTSATMACGEKQHMKKREM
jgi:hypothetical protein